MRTKKIKKDVKLHKYAFEYRLFGIFRIRLNPLRMIEYNEAGSLYGSKHGLILRSIYEEERDGRKNEKND